MAGDGTGFMMVKQMTMEKSWENRGKSSDSMVVPTDSRSLVVRNSPVIVGFLGSNHPISTLHRV